MAGRTPWSEIGRRRPPTLAEDVLAAMERHMPVSRGVRWFVTTLPEPLLLDYLSTAHKELEDILHVRLSQSEPPTVL